MAFRAWRADSDVRSAARWLPIAIFLLTFAAYAALAPRVERRLDPLTGDEPFYAMTAHNLLAGRGLDETESWFEADYLSFYPPVPLPADWQGWPAFPPQLPPHDS